MDNHLVASHFHLFPSSKWDRGPSLRAVCKSHIAMPSPTCFEIHFLSRNPMHLSTFSTSIFWGLMCLSICSVALKDPTASTQLQKGRYLSIFSRPRAGPCNGHPLVLPIRHSCYRTMFLFFFFTFTL